MVQGLRHRLINAMDWDYIREQVNARLPTLGNIMSIIKGEKDGILIRYFFVNMQESFHFIYTFATRKCYYFLPETNQ